MRSIFPARHAAWVFLSLSFLLPAGASAQASFVRGHVNDDGVLNLSDAVQVFRFLFQGDPEPVCRDAADADDSGILNLTDGIHILSFLFRGGLSPVAPFPECGADSGTDDLDCGSFAACSPGSAIRVTGRTLDTSRLPITGARVSAGNEFAFSGIDGSFIIDGVARRAMLHVSAVLGDVSGGRDIPVDADASVIDAGDILLAPTQACGNVVARAAERGCGRVLVWGDEHVLFDEYLPGSAPFWENALAWLAEPTCSIGQRTRVGVLQNRLHDGTSALLQELGFQVSTVGAQSELEGIDILIAPPFGGVTLSLPAWIEEGGSLMTFIAGIGDRAPDECDRANALLTPLGLEYDCLHKAPWGPVSEFAEHPVTLGLVPENAPFVNGRFVVDVPGFTSDAVARIGDCFPIAVPDCRKPLDFDGAEPVNVEGVCGGGPALNGGSNSSTGEPELHVLGIYEPEGEVKVVVERPTRMVLFLSSYEDTQWSVEVGPLAIVEKVFVSALSGTATATAPEGIPVVIVPPEGSSYSYGDDCGGGNAPRLIAAAETASGLQMRSFHGCYRSSGFRIRD